MKKVILLAVAVAFTSVGFAQKAESLSAKADQVETAEKKTSPEDCAKMRAERLSAELKLDDKQKKVVYEVTLDEMTKKDRARMQRAEMKQRNEDSMERSNARIAEVLTPEQNVLWEKNRAERSKKSNYDDKSKASGAKSDCGSKSAAKPCCSEKKK